VLVILAALLPRAVVAQTILGTVLGDGDGRPVSGAAVFLLDGRDEMVVRTTTDALGRFRITPPEAGTFTLAAERLGYRVGRSPLLALDTRGTVRVELTLMPAPIGLEGLDVAVEPSADIADELRLSGVEPRSLGNRWITRPDIEKVASRYDIGSLLEWQQIPSMRVLRSENTMPIGEDMHLCISLQRARTGAGYGRCALAVVDGQPVSNKVLKSLNPESVEAIAVLQPIEATFLFGIRGEAGAVMVWTRRGGR
jgi:hypothetical protein